MITNPDKAKKFVSERIRIRNTQLLKSLPLIFLIGWLVLHGGEFSGTALLGGSRPLLLTGFIVKILPQETQHKKNPTSVLF